MATTFQDDNGNTSSTRVKTFIAAMVAFAIALIIVLTKEKIDTNGLIIIAMLLAYSFGEKTFNKFAEIKKDIEIKKHGTN